jgi:molybdate transport system substrate-binding protein
MAAVTLKPALDAIVVDAYRDAGGGPVVVSYGATPAPARQIEQGAPADIFVSADPEWMGYLVERTLIRAASRVDLVSTELVLIGSRSSAVSVTLVPGVQLGPLIGEGPLAVCNRDHHPAGGYARASLEALGIWASVAPKIARVENVQVAVTMVGRGDAPLGIVFATDATADERVRIVGVFPAESHPPIVFPAALTSSQHPDASRFPHTSGRLPRRRSSRGSATPSCGDPSRGRLRTRGTCRAEDPLSMWPLFVLKPDEVVALRLSPARRRMGRVCEPSGRRAGGSRAGARVLLG